MAKKVLGSIGFGVNTVILLLYLITTFLATESDGKAMLILVLPFVAITVLGLIGTLIADKKKVLSIIFIAIAGLGSPFMGLMCLVGGMPLAGIIALPLGFINLFLYIISAVLTGISKLGE